jgi:hypothetical protein
LFEIFLSADLYRLCKLGIFTIEEISIFSNSSHLEWRAELSDTSLKGTHPGIIAAMFGLIWFSIFRGEDLNVIFYQNMPNLHYQYISRGDEILIVHCCFNVSQNELKNLLQLHGKE